MGWNGMMKGEDEHARGANTRVFEGEEQYLRRILGVAVSFPPGSLHQLYLSPISMGIQLLSSIPGSSTTPSL